MRVALVINLTNLADIAQPAAKPEVSLRIVTACDSPLACSTVSPESLRGGR